MARVRLIDVAELAGVSMKTVSNVVHNYPHVAPALRQKVQSAIDDLGYKPNLTARRLATGKTGMIALAIPEIDHPYFSELSRCIAEEASRRGYRVIMEQTLSDTVAEHAVLQDREAGLVDGVIFHPMRMQALELAKSQRDTPLVLLGESAVPVTTDHVMVDNVAAARDGVRHLVALGRRRIAFLGIVADDITVTTNRRLLGYQEALVEAGIPLDPELVLMVPDFTPESCSAAIQAAIAGGLSFDAVLCREDKFAVGALQGLHRAGLEVPRDVAVIGWDDTAVTSFTRPTLTSISPDKVRLASTALDLLEERMNGHQGSGRHRLVPHSITVRESAPAIPG